MSTFLIKNLYFNDLYTFWQKHDILKLSTVSRGSEESNYRLFAFHRTLLICRHMSEKVSWTEEVWMIPHIIKLCICQTIRLSFHAHHHRAPVIFYTGHWNLDPRIPSTGRFWVLTYEHQEITYTVIRFVSISAKFGICTVVNLYGTLVD
jgi:hypothetical protein